MEIQTIILAGVIVSLAGMAQSTVGFGYALFSTPLLVLIGIPLPSVITLVATCSLIQSFVGALKLRASVPWRLSLSTTAIRLVSIIIGLFLLKRLAAVNTDYVRMVIGGVLSMLVIIQLVWRPRPVRKLHWSWAGLAFFSSGLLAGAFGMGGPPLVLWSMAHDWPTQKTRGFLFAVFATTIPIQIALLSFTFGTEILRNVALGIAFLPLVYLGTAIGIPLGNRLPRTRLRYISYIILLGIGISAVVPPFLAQFKLF